MAEKVLAAVRTGPSKTEMREYPMPDIPEDSALMKMEVAGICGTDVKLYKTPPTKSPVIMRTLVEGQKVSYDVVTERGKQAAGNLQAA